MENVRYYKVYEEPFEVFGLYGNVKTDGFKRLPDNIGQNVNDRVTELYKTPRAEGFALPPMPKALL